MATGYQIPISYVVSASTVTPSAGLEPLKLSTILLLTDTQPISEMDTDYVIARTATTIANAFGTNEEITTLANTIFSQQPNILANNGYIIAAPMLQSVTPDPTPATAGTLVTPVLTDSIEVFAAVTDGVLNLTIDGTATEVTGLDFAGVETVAGIAAVIQAKYTTVDVNAVDGAIQFTSQTTGANSTVTIAAMTESNGTDLYNTTLLNGAACTATAGTDEVVYPERQETVAEAITRISGEIYFNGIITTRDLTETEAQVASTTVQAMTNRIFFLPAASTSALTSIFSTVASNYNTKCLLYTLRDDDNTAVANARKFAAAYASRGLAVNYSGSNTTLTMNLKTLTGIEADTNINETILNSCASVGADCYPSIEGLAKVVSNSQNGYYFDQVENRIWLVNTIQREVFNALATTSTKIPQTESGMQILVNAIGNVCEQAVANGMAAAGTWNSADTFGDYDDFIRNISEHGYYIYYQPIAEQSQTERETRQAPLIQVAIKEAGAIHSANILIYIEA